MAILLIQSDFCYLVVTRLTRFHCNLKILCQCQLVVFLNIYLCLIKENNEFELTHETKFWYTLGVIYANIFKYVHASF